MKTWLHILKITIPWIEKTIELWLNIDEIKKLYKENWKTWFCKSWYNNTFELECFDCWSISLWNLSKDEVGLIVGKEKFNKMF